MSIAQSDRGGIFQPDHTPKSATVPAPQIAFAEEPDLIDPFNAAVPAGLGPVPPWWQARSIHASTYDAAWLTETHPRLPADFDYRFYQAGPPHLIQRGYLFPGTAMQTTGLWTHGQALGFALPDIVPVARFDFTDGREVKARLHLDGLHLDLSGPRPAYDLTWRTWIETCPALYRVDLDLVPWHDVPGLELPVAGPEGLVQDTMEGVAAAWPGLRPSDAVIPRVAFARAGQGDVSRDGSRAWGGNACSTHSGE